MIKTTKKEVNFSSGKAMVSILFVSSMVGRYISGKDYEIFIYDKEGSKDCYTCYITKVGDRLSYIDWLGSAKAITVIKIAQKYGINIADH
tara:strand:+ start:182 stop:451 length:270 start_codon:yes stop_codon:yes gene_type:complete